MSGRCSYGKCLEGEWSVRADIERLRSYECPVRVFILVVAKGEQETTVGARLRNDEWVVGGSSVDVDLGCALVRMWVV